MRAAAYARYSSDKQRESSIQDQVRNCTAFAEREGWDMVAQYSDEAVSGISKDRPGFKRLRSPSTGPEHRALGAPRP